MTVYIYIIIYIYIFGIYVYNSKMKHVWFSMQWPKRAIHCNTWDIILEYHLFTALWLQSYAVMYLSLLVAFPFRDVFVVPPLDPPFVRSELQQLGRRVLSFVETSPGEWLQRYVGSQTKNWDIGKFARSSTRVLPASFQFFRAVNKILHREMLPIPFPIVLIHFFWVVVGIGVAGSICRDSTLGPVSGSK